MTGWRIGYIAGPEDIIKKMSEIRHSLSINSCTFSQFGALAALEGKDEEIGVKSILSLTKGAFFV